MSGLKSGMKFMLAALSAACLLMPYSAIAEEAQKAKETEKIEEKQTETYTLEVVKVTARKKEESVQDIPMSVKVMSGEDLEQAGINKVEDVVRYAPNVVMRENHPEENTVIRGMITPMTLVNSPVGFYIDDVSQPIPYMRDPDLFDIERIEILKGPQSTLYGHNCESGVINIITKQPDNEFRAKVFSSFANYNSLRAGGKVSGPIVEDRLYIGLSLLHESTDGYMKNIFDDTDASSEDHITGRGTLRWTPTNAWDITLKVDAMRGNDKAGVWRFEDGPNKTDRHEINYDGANSYDTEYAGQSLKAKYDAGPVEILSVTTHSDFKSKLVMDFDMTAAGFGDIYSKFKNHVLAQEIRVSSKTEGPLEWLIGLYGQSQKNEIWVSGAFMGDHAAKFWSTNLAAFGEATYTLFDILHLTGGLRYDHLGMSGTKHYTPVAGATTTFEKDMQFDEFLPKFSASVDVTDNVMAYATVAKGYLSGSYAHGFATSDKNFAYEPEYNWSYEAGVKSTWFDNKFTANFSAFYIDMQDKQVTEWVAPLINAIRNAKEAYSQGFELELNARPIQGLDVFGGVGYIEARFKDWNVIEAGGNPFSYDDLSMPFIPKWTGNVGAQYHHTSGLFGRVDMTFQSAFWTDPKNTIEIEGHEQFNVKAGYEMDGLEFSLWCKNLFDKEYVDQRWAWGASHLIQDGAPRQYGGSISYAF